ncbi:MAG: TonB-dependent receptor, partial [Gemmatimonadaceae bacterium]|nr:TonB-dependent receptor [Gemmatimonadaceae bacterium]
MKFRSIVSLAAAIAALCVSGVANAQVGSSTDILMGQVLGPDSLPVNGARIEATSVESGTVRTRTTGADGRYTIVFPDGGGNYRVTVSAIGFTPQAINLTRQADEDRFVGNVRLGRFATVLSAVTVRTTQARPGQNQRPEAGNQERNLSPLIVNRLPVDQSDLNNLAALTPGIIAVSGSDTTSASFSVAGQPANQNNITLDGLSFGSGSVPQEGVRNTRIVTATYDVSRGQFTGGQIATTTRGGSNNFQGAVNLSRRDPNLEFSEDTGDGFSPRYTQTQLSAGAGGPIIKNKFFTFASLQLNRRTDPLQSLLVADPLSLQRLGTNTDSVNRFISLLNSYGLTPTQAFIPDERVGDNASALVRFDYHLGESNTIMVRGDWRGNVQDASRISALSVPHSGGNAHTSGGGGMVTLTSNWSMYINELRAYESVSNRSSAPYLAAPGGRVVVSSVLTDGSVGVSTLQFGGNTGLPQNARTRYTEVSDEVSRLTTAGGHRFKLGGLLNEERSFSGVVPNGLGTFTFNSLADFEADRPSSFTRTLFARDREARTVNAAVYLGDSWRKSADLQLTYGLRLEATKFGNEPALNPEIESLFGLRTDRFPGEVHLSPRAGFTYFLRRDDDGRPAATIRGGFGEFRGRAAAQLFGSASDATGLASGQSQIFCVGNTVPVPDWDAYLSSPQSIPTSCNGSSSFFGNQRRNVTVIAPSFGAPRAWRSSLGVTRRLLDRYSLSVDAAYARGVAQTGATDINLDTIPEFRLASEANRPVFAPTRAIVPGTGVVSLTGSRLHPEYGTVSEVMSRLSSDTKQLTLGLNGATRRGILLNMSYTLTRSRDQAQGLSSGGFGGGVSTSGNPNVAEWGTSDLERRHSFLTTVTWPVKPAFELSAVGRLTSG